MADIETAYASSYQFSETIDFKYKHIVQGLID